jgi:O-antigen ligase
MTLSLEARRTVVVIAGLVALLGAMGITEARLFHQASTLKYALTVVGPLFVGVLAMSTRPIVLITALLVIAAPFAGFNMTFQALRVPLLAPILIIGTAIAMLSPPQRAPRSALAAAGLLLLATFVLPTIESPVPTDVLVVLASLFVAGYLVSRASATPEGFRAIVWAFVASAAIQAALAIWESTTGNRLNLYGSAGAQTFGANSGYFFGYLGTKTRPPGAFYDPISLGNMLAIAVPLSAGLAIHYAGLRRWLKGGAAILALGVIVVGLEITLSRMSWVGAAVGLAVAALLLPRPQRRVVLPALVLVFAVTALVGAFGGHSSALQRLSSITHPLNETGTAQGDVLRVEIWQRAASIAVNHPVAGIGFGELRNVIAGELVPAGTQSHAHSTYLQLAAEGGAIALLGLLAVLLALRRDLGRALRDDRLWGAALVGSGIAMLICWLTDVTIRYSGVAVCMGVVFGLVAGSARRARAAPSGTAAPTVTTRQPGSTYVRPERARTQPWFRAPFARS